MTSLGIEIPPRAREFVRKLVGSHIAAGAVRDARYSEIKLAAPRSVIMGAYVAARIYEEEHVG